MRKVYASFKEIASQEKNGSGARRKTIIVGLLRACQEYETRYIVRALARNMRIGANTTLVLGALAHAVVKFKRLGAAAPEQAAASPLQGDMLVMRYAHLMCRDTCVMRFVCPVCMSFLRAQSGSQET